MASFALPTPDEENAFAELTAIIEDLPRFALVFALCASDAAASDHITNYKALHPNTQTSSYDVPWPDGRITKRLCDLYVTHKPDVIFVLGMDAWTKRDDQAEPDLFTKGLNHGRDELYEHVQCPVVFWCTPTVYNHIRRTAHDFYSVATATIWASLPDVIDSKVSRYSGDPFMSNSQALKPEERNFQIAELKSLIDAVDPDVDDSVRSNYYYHLSELLLADGQFVESRAAAKKALSSSRKENDPSFHAALLTLLGNNENALENRKKAKFYYTTALGILSKNYGRQNPSTASVIYNLATIEQFAGNIDKARELYTESKKLSEDVSGADSPTFISTTRRLAQLEMMDGNTKAARPLLEQILPIEETMYGENHPDVSITLQDLAKLEQIDGNLALAKAYFEKVLAIREATLGFDHKETALVLADMAVLAYEQNDLELSRALGRQASSIFRNKLGEKNETTRKMYRFLDFVNEEIKQRIMGAHPRTRSTSKSLMNSVEVKPVFSLLSRRLPVKKKK